MGWATPEKPIPAGIAGPPACRLMERRSVMPELPQYRMFIGGEWLAAKSGEWFESYDPYAGKPWALVARGGPADVDAAASAAHAAFTSGGLAKFKPTQRGVLLRRLCGPDAADADKPAALDACGTRKLIAEMGAQRDYLP